jgi:hypothetical protein
MWFAVFLAIGLPALLATRWFVIRIERKRKTAFVNDLMDAIQADRPKPAMRQRILAAGRFGLLLPIWPLATAALLADLAINRVSPSADDFVHPDEAYNATDHLTKRITISQAEAIENPLDPKRDRPARPFGYLAEAWSLFLTRQQVGAELWAFERPQGSTRKYDDRYSRGYCWVRAGKVIAELAVEGVPGVRLVKTPRTTDQLRG